MAKKRALISVFNKEDIEQAARMLCASGWEILSTGGTARYLQDHGIAVTDVADITGFGEILDGRVKTLHPLVFGPILARSEPAHMQQLSAMNTSPIDLVMVNFYPFEKALENKEKKDVSMVENIDIGGPSMVRAAAKNFASTAVVVEPGDYLPVARALCSEQGLSLSERRELASRAFAYTAFYDSLIARYFLSPMETPPLYLPMSGRRNMELRYGENPHQQGALYLNDPLSPFMTCKKIQGKSLSFNNILDLSMVYNVVNSFADSAPFTVIVKHQNPCGAAQADTLAASFSRALAGDPMSAYGGIVGFNATLDAETAAQFRKIFFEVIIAPDFTEEALEILKPKKKLRIIRMPLGYQEPGDVKTVPGGFVWQQADLGSVTADKFVLKTARQPEPDELKDAEFGWKMIKHVKSNAILAVKNRQIIGVGAGQMSRVDAVKIAFDKSRNPLDGAVLISDAYFPFSDSIELAAAQGIRTIVEPGGSIRDQEVIDMAQQHEITLLFTGMRHFRH